MNKRGLALSSLVMAIPAGYLAYLSVSTVFGMNESMPTLVTIIVWTLIILSALIALSPFIFLVAGPSGAVAVAGPALAAPAPVADPKKKPAKKAASDDDEFSSDDDISASDDDSLNTDDEQLFDTSDDEAGADDFEDNFNFDDDDAIEEEEEPAPKKKKKK